MATYYKFLFGELTRYRDPVSYGAKLSETKAGRSKRRKNKRIKK